MGPYDTTIGSLLLGVFFNTFLYGLVIHQFAAYYRIKFNDPPVVKYMALFLFILDTFHSVSVIYMVWNYLVTNHNNPAALEAIGWPFAFTPFCTALAALATQMFLGYRIWILTKKNNVLLGLVIVVAVPSFALGLVCSIETWNIQVFSSLYPVGILMIAWLSTQVLVDVFITITLIIIFSRSRTGVPHTDTIIDRLIRCAIRTGLFAAVFCVAVLVTLVAFPDTYLHGMFAIPIGRVYTNTLLHTLIIRKSLKEDIASRNLVSFPPRLTTSPPNSPTDESSCRGGDVMGDV